MVTNRSKGQTMIGCWCDESFVEKIDNARGGINRSQFCRDALTEKLQGMGIKVDMFERYAPIAGARVGRRKRAIVGMPSKAALVPGCFPRRNAWQDARPECDPRIRAHDPRAHPQLTRPPRQLLGHFKPLGRRPLRGNLLEFRLQHHSVRPCFHAAIVPGHLDKGCPCE